MTVELEDEAAKRRAIGIAGKLFRGAYRTRRRYMNALRRYNRAHYAVTAPLRAYLAEVKATLLDVAPTPPAAPPRP